MTKKIEKTNGSAAPTTTAVKPCPECQGPGKSEQPDAEGMDASCTRCGVWFRSDAAPPVTEEKSVNGAANGAARPMRKLSWPRALACKLTKVEALEHAQVAAKLDVEAAEREAKLASHAKQEKDEIAGLKSRCRSELRIAREELEYKDVHCAEYRDDKKGDMVVVRLDTGEEVERRQLSNEEKQIPLFEVANNLKACETRIANLEAARAAGLPTGKDALKTEAGAGEEESGEDEGTDDHPERASSAPSEPTASATSVPPKKRRGKIVDGDEALL